MIKVDHVVLSELDLDYLERRGGDRFEPEATSGSASNNKEEDSPADTLERVKVIILGAAGVGKTSIIRVCIYRAFGAEIS